MNSKGTSTIADWPKTTKHCKNKEEEKMDLSFCVSISVLIFPAYFDFYMIYFISQDYLKFAISVKWNYNWCNNPEQKAPKYIKLLKTHITSQLTLAPLLILHCFEKTLPSKSCLFIKIPHHFFNVFS